jgi:hypothetical protein
MAVDRRRAHSGPGLARPESGMRVAAAWVTDEAPTQPQGESVHIAGELPTRQLELAEVRRMALRCASDVGADVPVADADVAVADDDVLAAAPPAPAPRARLELVLTDEDDEWSHDLAPRPRAGRVVVAVVLVAAVVAAALWVFLLRAP